MKRIFGYLTLTRTLLEHGANVNAFNKCFDTILHHAVLNDNPDVVALLVWNGAKADARTLCERTTLYLASGSISPPRAQIVRVLLDAGADKDVLDRDARTPLHLAAMNGDINVISILLDFGANVEAEDLHETKGRFISLSITAGQWLQNAP